MNSKKFLKKVFITFLINWISLSVGATMTAQTITYGANGNNILVENGVINCGGLMCPPTTTLKCTILEESYDNNNYIKSTKSCLGANNTPISQTVTTSVNPRPGYLVQSYMEATTNGNVVQCNGCTQLDPEQTQQVLNNVNTYVGQTMNNVQTQLNQVQAMTGNLKNLGQTIHDQVNTVLNNIRFR